MEANAIMRAIVGPDARNSAKMLEILAEESGILSRLPRSCSGCDRKRKGKRLSNAEWASPTDHEARIAELKDGRTRLAYKPEHAVDLGSGANVAAEVRSGRSGRNRALPEHVGSLAEANLRLSGAGPTADDPARLIADKGYQSRDGLKEMEDGDWKSRVAENKVADIHPVNCSPRRPPQ